MEPNNPYYQAPQGQPAGQPSGYIPPVVPGQPQQQPQPSHSQQQASKPVVWIVTVSLLSVLLLSAIGFGTWAYMERQDYKDHSDQKAAAAVEVAKKQQTDEDNVRFAEEMKNPLRTWTGPSSYGSIKVLYPKTWSGYVNLISGDNPVDAYFQPDVVPAVVGADTGSRQAIALHVQVVADSYSDQMQNVNELVKSGELKAKPYSLPKQPKVVGVILKGKLTDQVEGTQIMLPLRDKTLIITTETDQFLKDWDKYIIPNMTFEP